MNTKHGKMFPTQVEGAHTMQLLWKIFKKAQLEANIDECGIEIGTPQSGYQYVVTKPYVLHVVMTGTGTIVYNHQTYHLNQGDLFLLKRGMDVHYYSAIEDPWTYYWVGFSGKLANDYLKRTTLEAHPIVQNRDTSEITKLIYKMCQRSISYDIHASDDIMHMQELYQLFYLLHQSFPKPFKPVENEIYSNVRKAIHFMNQNYMKPIKIQDVADHVNMSRSYLYKLFIKHVDQSPQHYLVHLRMYHAALCLKETSKQSQEIAYLVGYKDPLQFSKAFKAYYGVSVSQYRKNNKPIKG